MPRHLTTNTGADAGADGELRFRPSVSLCVSRRDDETKSRSAGCVRFWNQRASLEGLVWGLVGFRVENREEK